MKKILSITAGVLIIATLISGCKAKEEKKLKVNSDTVTSSTLNGTSQNQEQAVTVSTPVDAATSATVPVDMSLINYSCNASPVNITKNDWLTALAGGKESTISVKIHPSNAGGSSPEEFYLELEGKGGKITLVSNGMSAGSDADNTFKRVTVEFLTGKRLVGKEVVKDYSKGKEHITVIFDYDKEGILTSSVMFCSTDDSVVKPKDNYYKLKINK